MRIQTFTLFASITSRFISLYRREALEFVNLLQSGIAIEMVYESAAFKRLVPLFEQYFNEAAMAGNTLVERQISSLSRALNVPFKYNKDVISRINGKSIFTGYYNERYASTFSRSEIDRLKRTILKGTYEGLSERQLATEIRSTISVSERRARLLARGETSRLRNGIKDIYFQDPGVQEQYDLVWKCAFLPASRESHKELDGVKADRDGLFRGNHSPPIAPNCMCVTNFVKK